MKEQKTYLSDEQLQSLMAEVEERELVQAPGDILSGVLRKLEEKEPTEPLVADQKVMPKGKVIEFRRYCIRVVTSAVAAIALIFALPGLSNAQREEDITKQAVIAHQKEKSRKELRKEERLTKKIGDSRLILDGELFDIIKKLGGK